MTGNSEGRGRGYASMDEDKLRASKVPSTDDAQPTSQRASGGHSPPRPAEAEGGPAPERYTR